jgi:hypothetical protein
VSIPVGEWRQQYQYAWDKEDGESVGKPHFTKGVTEGFRVERLAGSTIQREHQKNQEFDISFSAEKVRLVALTLLRQSELIDIHDLHAANENL